VRIARKRQMSFPIRVGQQSSDHDAFERHVKHRIGSRAFNADAEAGESRAAGRKGDEMGRAGNVSIRWVAELGAEGGSLNLRRGDYVWHRQRVRLNVLTGMSESNCRRMCKRMRGQHLPRFEVLKRTNQWWANHGFLLRSAAAQIGGSPKSHALPNGPAHS